MPEVLRKDFVGELQNIFDSEAVVALGPRYNLRELCLLGKGGGTSKISKVLRRKEATEWAKLVSMLQGITP